MRRRKVAPRGIFNKLLQVPLLIWLLYAVLSAMGFMMLYSAAGGHWSPWAELQFWRFVPGLLFTLVLAQPTLSGQASAFTQVLVPAGQPMGNVRLNFSNLVYVPDADGNNLTLSTVMFLGIEVTYLFSVGENDPTLGSASGDYDISQVVLVPGPGAAAILAAWGLATARRRTR